MRGEVVLYDDTQTSNVDDVVHVYAKFSSYLSHLRQGGKRKGEKKGGV